MPIAKIKLRPGFNRILTQTADGGGWFSCNLVRWFNGLLQKVGGWERLFATQCAGYVRAIHAYEDLTLANNLLLGTDGGAQIYVDGTLYTPNFLRRSIVYTGSVVTFTPTAASATVLVTDTAHGAIVGNSVNFPISLSVGGRTILGGTTVTVVTVPSANTWTFTMAQVALNSTVVYLQHEPQNNPTDFAIPFIYFDPATPYTGILYFIAHGLSVGGTFTLQAETTYILTASGGASVIIPAGTVLTALTVPTADTFTFSFYAFGSYNFNPGGTWYHYFYEGGNTIAGTTPTLVNYSTGAPSTDIWSIDNLGNNGLLSAQNGPIYVYTPPITTDAIYYNAGAATTPQINSVMFVAMPQAQVISLGSEVTLGGGVQDPLLIRFSDAGSYSSWTAASTNQAGSYRLSRGSRIIGGIQAPQTTLVWTDTDLWSMLYQGPPLIYSFSIIGAGCGLIAAKARVTLGTNTIWMGTNSFWIYNGNGVQPLPCDVWDAVFNNINRVHAHKCHAGSNSGFTEAWFFYPSVDADEIDSYVKVNLQNPSQPLWDYGTMTRTAWLDNNVFGNPLAGDANYRIQQHEMGYDDDGSAMAGVFAESGYADLADGSEIMFADQIIPDFNWMGTNGSVNILLRTVNYPGDRSNVYGPYSATNVGSFLSIRLRARQIAVRFEWAAFLGFSARVGAPRFRTAPSGKKS